MHHSRHEVTLDDIKYAMETEILLASSCDARTKRAKDLKYQVNNSTYWVRCFDGKKELKYRFTDPRRALGQYNAFDA